MKNPTMTKEEVAKYLIELFPGFSKVWNSGDTLYREEDGSYTYHGLFLEFSVYFRDHFNDFSDEQLKKLFSKVEGWERKETSSSPKDDEQLLSNAVFTCFLENIAGEGFTRRIEPFMGKKSREYYSHYDYEPMDKKVYEEQMAICRKYANDYIPVAMDSMLGISDN